MSWRVFCAHLLQCGETSQLVQHYVVFCCDCSQSWGGRQEDEMGQTAGVVGLLLLLLLLRFPLLLLFYWGSAEGLAEDATCRVGVPHSQYAFNERGKNISDGETHKHTTTYFRNEPLLPAVMKCNLGFFTPIWEKSWFSGRKTTPSTACRQREQRQMWSWSVFPQVRRYSLCSQPYLIDWYSSLGILLLQVPHCADLISARATNEAHAHARYMQTL